MYEKSVIYQIKHKSKPIVYIGGTINYLSRVHQHKMALKKPKTAVDNLIIDNGGWEAFDISPIKKFPCKDKLELLIEIENVKRSLPKEELKEIYKPAKPFLALQRRKYTEADLE